MHLEAVKTALAARMAYRGDFFISAAIMLIAEFIVPLVTFLIYRTGASFPGWSLYEALLIQGVFLLAKGVAFPLFFDMVWNILNLVREGTFDLLLIKPRSILHLVIATGFDCEDLGKLAGGIFVFTLALVHLPAPGPSQWLQFFMLFAFSLSVLFSSGLILSGIVFIWVGCSRVYEIFDSVMAFGQYPRTIFTRGWIQIVTLMIPVAVVGFFPAAVLLGKPAEWLGIAVIATVVFLGFSLRFWYWMLRKYSSAGG
jgi:ABC-2 type transport system permease protein